MNKIYNNLSVENLIKTKWFNQFDEYQKQEIREGLKDNLDVSVYAKKEFEWEQMNEIRVGLRDNLDVLFYAKSEYSWAQMEAIREGLKDNLNVVNLC